MNIENTLTYLFAKISIAQQNSLQLAMREIGLERGQVFVLISLWKVDGQSQIDLANNLKLTAPTINKMIGSLMKNDLVECRRCAHDGRMMRVYLTDKSVRVKEAAEEQWRKIEANLFESFTETEKLILNQLFSKMKVNLDGNVGSPLNDL